MRPTKLQTAMARWNKLPALAREAVRVLIEAERERASVAGGRSWARSLRSLLALLEAVEAADVAAPAVVIDRCGLLTKTGVVCLQALGHRGRCRTPVREGNHVCPTCRSSFSSWSSLLRHRRRKHPDRPLVERSA